MIVALALLAAAPGLLLAQVTPAPATEERGYSEPSQPGDQVVWASSFDEAVARARKLPSGRVFVELYEETCGECQRMRKLIYPSASFVAFTRDRVPVKLDRTSPEGKRLAEKFGVPQVPGWLVITPDDELLSGIQVGPTTQGAWFETWVRTEVSWIAFKKKLAAEAKDPSDVGVVYDVAIEIFKRGGDSMAEPRFARLSRDARATPEIRDQSLAYLATIYLDAGNIEGAAGTLEKLRKVGRDATLREKAELRLADVEIARGRKDKAADRLREFKKAHPSSPLVPDADRLLRALTPHLGETKER